MTTHADPFRLDGELVLITGGGTGLGLGIARCVVRQGAKVILAGRTESTLAEAVTQLGTAAAYEVHDVTDAARTSDFIQRASRHHGPISVLVNNAGIHLKKPAIETTAAEMLSVYNTHVAGAHALCSAVAPGMIERQHGSMIFIASMASLFGIPRIVAYSAAKSACLGVVRTLAVELSPHGIRVNAIAPGWIDSPMMRKAVDSDPERKAKILGRTPMNRFGTPDDVGHAAVYLASPAGKFVTGSCLVVDGGASVGF